MEKVIIGNAELWHGDCCEILPLLPKHDLVLTDPPYGIGIDKRMARESGNAVGKGHRRANRKAYEELGWDDAPPSPELLDLVVRAGDFAALFGGNYFSLPPSGGWLVWDKLNGENYFADCELVWTNLKTPIRLIRHLWNGFARAGNEVRFNHPTQKPVAVVAWVMGCAKKSMSVIDPFMGSGTTGVACAQLGKVFTGIERERKYFDIACQRIEDAQRQAPLIQPDKPAPQEQTSFI